MLKKTFTIILILFLILSIIFSGCTEKTETTSDNLKSDINHAPIGDINAPKQSFFDDLIEFDATNSHDTDGEIISYNWDFGDGITASGTKVTHAYIFQNEFDITFPLIYTIILFVTDNDNSVSGTSYQISLYPKEFTFYLDKNKLTTEKPTENEETIKANFLADNEEINYEFEDFVTLSTCNWNLKILLKKPLFSKLNNLNVVLLDINGYEIASSEYFFKNLDFWTEKYIDLSGKINSNCNFKSLKISIHGFTIRNKINIFYGGDNPSFISFSFLN